MNERTTDNTSLAQKEWNDCLLFRNKQLTRELKEFRSLSAAAGCSSSQLLAMSQLLRLHTAPAYGIIRNEQEWRSLFSILDVLYGSSLAASLAEFNLNPQELKLCYLVRARLKNKVIGVLFNITATSVLKAKQRLKPKLGLGAADCFDRYIQSR